MTTNRELTKLIRVLEAFRDDCDKEIPVQQILAFLRVIEADGDISQVDLAKKLRMSQQSTSRSIHAFTDLNWMKKPGFKFLRYAPDPFDLRRKVIVLQPRGRAFAQKIMNILGG